MTKISCLFSFVFSLSCLNAQIITIKEARTKDTGAVVSVRGIATNGTELGQTIRYFQDSTAGLSAFFSNTTLPAFAAIKRGDSIEVTGKLKIFNGLLEIDPIQNFKIINSNNPVPPPLSILSASDWSEANESKLVKILSGTFANGGSTFSGNTNYNFTAGGATYQVRINSGSALIGKLIPSTSVNLTGILSEFRGVYQLLPRDEEDIQSLKIDFDVLPFQEDITKTGFSINWVTSLSGTSEVLYGTAPDKLTSSVKGTQSATNHKLSLSGLAPATVYFIQVKSTDSNNNTVVSRTIPMITASNSGGAVRIYFNYPVDTSISTGSKPLASNGLQCEKAIADLIAAAKLTVDAAYYNNASTLIVNALKDAAKRGVRVRYIADGNTSNEAIRDTNSLGFKVIRRPTGDLMHNKFLVIDTADVNNAWVVSGAMNITQSQMFSDYNHLIAFQDQSLAKVYTMEFDEMWGSTTATPNASAAKFGDRKTDNTPKKLVVGGRKVEVYFSPTDRTANAIINAINTANNDVQFALLVFTYFDLGTALNNARIRGARVRGLVDEDTVSTSQQFNFLARNGAQMRIFKSPFIFHHKYCIIDAQRPSSDPTVVTGSHNWSNAAEQRHDENTLIIHDATIANVFLQDFEARWKEMNTAVVEQYIEGFTPTLFPNPARDVLNIAIKNEVADDFSISIVNAQGQLIESRILKRNGLESVETIPLSYLPTGQYFVRFGVGNKITARTFQVIR